jgi:murein L,D-transpeptidase YafK
MKYIVTVVFSVICFCASAQQSAPPRDFLKYQKSFKNVTAAFTNMEDTLKAQFAAKKLAWPAKYLYIRSFKYDSQLEVWVKNDKKDPYQLFKTYKVCALAGNLGPKRFEGDFQVPEGFYYINEFKPNSNYHMALGVNYPNASDRVLSDSLKPGANIYVHGSCVTVGCIPLTDKPIEELYVLAAVTRGQGQDYIPIHLFPVRFKSKKNRDMLDKYLLTRPEYKPMVNSLMTIYYYFEKNKQIPTILVNKKGGYSIAEDFKFVIPKPEPEKVFVENSVSRKTATKVINFADNEFFASVYKMPVFPGGATAFQTFLDDLSTDLSEYLPPVKKRIFVQVDFVIDKAGNLVNVKVGDNANNEINNLILERFESLPKWAPAIRQEPVAIRLQQSIMIDAKPAPPPQKDEDD